MFSALVLTTGLFTVTASRPHSFARFHPEHAGDESRHSRSDENGLLSKGRRIISNQFSAHAAESALNRNSEGPMASSRRALAKLFGASEQPELGFTQKRRLKEVFRNKLQRVPVFMVTTEEGAPFLANHMGVHSGQWHVYAAKMYLDIRDAQKAKKTMENMPGSSKDKIRIFVINMHRGFMLAKEPPTPTGADHPDMGKKAEARMVYAFQEPSRKRTDFSISRTPPIPLYEAEGLVIKKGGQKVRPLFMSKEDCAAAMSKHNLKKRHVYNGLSMLNHLHAGIERGDPNVAQDLLSIEIVPPSRIVAARKDLKKEEAPPRVARIVD